MAWKAPENPANFNADMADKNGFIPDLDVLGMHLIHANGREFVLMEYVWLSRGDEWGAYLRNTDGQPIAAVYPVSALTEKTDDGKKRFSSKKPVASNESVEKVYPTNITEIGPDEGNDASDDASA